MILAFDTSTEAIAVGLADLSNFDELKDSAGVSWDIVQKSIIASDSISARRCANQKLISCIEEMLCRNNVSISDISILICGRGPGSFTGVRIGVATAKGIASGLRCPLHGVSTLDAVSWEAWARGVRGNVGVVGDALRKEVYPVRYVLDDDGVTRLDHDNVDKPALMANRWAQYYADEKQKVLLVGDGLAKFGEMISETFDETGVNYEILPEDLWAVTGRGLILTFYELARRGVLGSGHPHTLLPVYTRLSDAEENERARKAKGLPMRGVLVNPVDFIEQSDTPEGLAPSSADGIPECGVALMEDIPLHQGGISHIFKDHAKYSGTRPLILAIETSCDETAAAVTDGNSRMICDLVATQVDFHKRFGGVVPEIASRKHTEAIVGVVDETMQQAGEALDLNRGLEWSDLDAIAVTQGPGLIGALVVGMAFAKGLSYATKIPLLGVNHLEGHIYANKLTNPDIKPPMVVSLLSGGHTMLVHVKDWGDYEVLGQTLDDAVGEAYDKVAKALGLGYPGGPAISKYAISGNPEAIDFPRAMLHSHDFSFSLSGLKTAVMTYIKDEIAKGHELNIADLSASFQRAVIDVQVAKALEAVKETNVKEFCLGGGVAANPELRQSLKDAMEKRGIHVTLPELSACTDNAGMIAAVAVDLYKKGEFLDNEADSIANMEL